MARPALSATRGLDIVDFLAAFPTRDFTLSEIVRATGINPASCHAVLNALADRGYVARAPGQKAFRLGPVLIAAGDAALRAHPLVALAREAASELAADLDIPVMMSAAVGDDIVGIIAVADSRGRMPGLRTGERRPLVPPLGAPFVAWDDEEAIAAWLAKGNDSGSEAEAVQRASLDLIRQRGFQVALRGAGAPRLGPEIGDMARGREAPRYRDHMVGLISGLGTIPMPEEIEPEARYDIVLIAAPLFDRAGACAFNLCLTDFPAPLSGREVLACAERLQAACLNVMQADRA
ncbi:helix-turn-helix domain-containing protein [Novosphingobium sp. TH158]|uniref:helix-turn-helix domain-containing protein n=1 Tax=Novosphingobium sp. TH158 TaxID=2067455 RepID=UPI0013043FCC|nr:helix-turn-helix domain-containing protein [Novosphingobium sp. TH158]